MSDKDEAITLCVMFIVLLVLGVLYVGHVNASDSALIEACKRDPLCVHPVTGARLD